MCKSSVAQLEDKILFLMHQKAFQAFNITHTYTTILSPEKAIIASLIFVKEIRQMKWTDLSKA